MRAGGGSIPSCVHGPTGSRVSTRAAGAASTSPTPRRAPARRRRPTDRHGVVGGRTGFRVWRGATTTAPGSPRADWRAPSCSGLSRSAPSQAGDRAARATLRFHTTVVPVASTVPMASASRPTCVSRASDRRTWRSRWTARAQWSRARGLPSGTCAGTPTPARAPAAGARASTISRSATSLSRSADRRRAPARGRAPLRLPVRAGASPRGRGVHLLRADDGARERTALRRRSADRRAAPFTAEWTSTSVHRRGRLDGCLMTSVIPTVQPAAEPPRRRPHRRLRPARRLQLRRAGRPRRLDRLALPAALRQPGGLRAPARSRRRALVDPARAASSPSSAATCPGRW